MVKYNIKANRIFTEWRRWAWIGTFLIAVGGLFEPLLGLLVLAVMAGLIITSFLRGRWWCGNICTHGSFYDLILIKFSKNAKIPKFLRSPVMVLFFLAFFMYNMGRGMINAFTSETLFNTKTLYLFPSQVDVTSTIGFLRAVGFVFVNTYWMVIVVSVALGLIFTSRTWCHFCPMGTFQRIFYALGRLLGVCKKTDVKISTDSKLLCHSCAKCNRVCPMQLHPYLEFDDNNQFGSDKCIKCKTCLKNCPADILSLHSESAALETTRQTEQGHTLKKSEHSAIIHEMTSLTPEVLEIVFKLETEGIQFTPGQFILVRINENPKINRAYSISKYDHENSTLRVTVKKAPNGYGTDIVFNTFKIGDKVTLEGFLGYELIIDKSAENILLVAGGIGVTPFIPILEDLTSDTDFKGNVHFVYGVNKENELIYRNDIEEMVKERPNFKFTPVVAFEEDYQGEKGFVISVIEKLSLNDTKIYMCGPKLMVANTEKLLEQMNFNKANLFVETA